MTDNPISTLIEQGRKQMQDAEMESLRALREKTLKVQAEMNAVFQKIMARAGVVTEVALDANDQYVLPGEDRIAFTMWMPGPGGYSLGIGTAADPNSDEVPDDARAVLYVNVHNPENFDAADFWCKVADKIDSLKLDREHRARLYAPVSAEEKELPPWAAHGIEFLSGLVDSVKQYGINLQSPARIQILAQAADLWHTESQEY